MLRPDAIQERGVNPTVALQTSTCRIEPMEKFKKTQAAIARLAAAAIHPDPQPKALKNDFDRQPYTNPVVDQFKNLFLFSFGCLGFGLS